MEIVIRKIGNSKGVVFPAHLLKELNLDLDDKADVTVVNGRMVIKPITKKKYSLSELLAQCDEKAPMPKELADWDAVESVGNEV